MTSFSRARRRTASLLAVAVLLLALVLSSCAGRGAARSGNTPGVGGGGATQTTSTNGDNAALNADISQLADTDAQLQAALGSADDAQAAANQDLSSQDSVANP